MPETVEALRFSVSTHITCYVTCNHVHTRACCAAAVHVKAMQEFCGI